MEKVIITMIDNFSTWLKGDDVEVSKDTAVRLVNELKVAKYAKPRLVEQDKLKKQEKVSREKKVIEKAPENKAL